MKHLKNFIDWIKSFVFDKEKVEEDVKGIVETMFKEKSKQEVQVQIIHQRVEEFKDKVNSSIEEFNEQFVKNHNNKYTLDEYKNELSLYIAIQPTIKSVRATTQISEDDPKDVIVDIVAIPDSVQNAKMEMKVTMKECAELFTDSDK